ncbi:MAG: ATP-binding cassette domain-containing protein [Ilumatobacteraceae bacterium]
MRSSIRAGGSSTATWRNRCRGARSASSSTTSGSATRPPRRRLARRSRASLGLRRPNRSRCCGARDLASGPPGRHPGRWSDRPALAVDHRRARLPLYDPTAGSVRIGGVDLRHTTLAEVRDTVVQVAQDVHLFHDTLGQQPALRQARRHRRRTGRHRGPPPSSGPWRPNCRLASTPSSATGATGCSGREQQRIAIARLLLKDLAVVVLDEAKRTPRHRIESAVHAALDAALVGRTSIVTAHRLATVRAADEIAVIEAGQVVERGTHDELVQAGGLYATLSRTQLLEPAR